MNKNLIKILAIASIALGAGACKGKKTSSSSETSSSEESENVISLAEAFALKTSGDYDFVHAGEEVTINNLSWYGYYGTTAIAGYPYTGSYYLSDLKGVEVELSEIPAGYPEKGKGLSDVTVKGTLTNVNGRPVLKNGSLVVNETEKYSGSCYISPDNFDREYYNEDMGRSASGALVEGIMQYASVPAAVTTEKGAKFQVAFPGENLDTEDPDNYDLIDVVIPDGLTEAAATALNTFFSGKAKGDFIDIIGLSRWDSSMTILLENRWGPSQADVPEEDRPVILTTWAAIQSKYNDKFKGVDVPDLAVESVGVYSYLLNDNFTGKLADLVGEDNLTKWDLDADKAGSFEVTANCATKNFTAVLDGAKAKAAAVGTLDEENSIPASNDFYYIMKDGEDHTVGEIRILGAENEKSITITFAGIRATDVEVASYSAAIAAFTTEMKKTVSTFESALPTSLGEVDANITSVLVDWKDGNICEGASFFEIDIFIAPGTFADDAAYEEYAETLTASIITNQGFEDDYAFPLAQMVSGGLFKNSSKEYLFVSLIYDEDEECYTGLSFYVFVETDAEKAHRHLFDVSADSVWTPIDVLYYAYDGWIYLFGEEQAPNAGQLQDGRYSIQDKWLRSSAALATFRAYFVNYAIIVPMCAQYQGTQTPDSEEDPGFTDTVDYFKLATATTDVDNTYVIFELDYSSESKGEALWLNFYIYTQVISE